MHAEANTYSRRWFDFFHVNISEARTMQEAAFVCRCAPLPGFRKIADVCCGMGRHARAFSKHGYSVIGLDRDADGVREGGRVIMDLWSAEFFMIHQGPI